MVNLPGATLLRKAPFPSSNGLDFSLWSGRKSSKNTLVTPTMFSRYGTSGQYLSKLAFIVDHKLDSCVILMAIYIVVCISTFRIIKARQ